MIDNWNPENMPIKLLDRSLLSSASREPYTIGYARAYKQDEDSIVALEKMLEDGLDTKLTGRFEASADWLKNIYDIPYQVSYYFPSTPRPVNVGSGSYGSPNLTYKALYEALCDHFNGGQRFIEQYFLKNFKEDMFSKFDRMVKSLKQNIVDEANRRRMQHRTYLRNFDVWTQPLVTSNLNELARQTKMDIIQCLQTGKIPLNKNKLSDRTIKARAKLGIPSNKVFFATGRLIKSIKVSIILLTEGTAEREGF